MLRSRIEPELSSRLDSLYHDYNRTDSASDPVHRVRPFTDPADREIAAFCAAALAFGRVASVLNSIDALFAIVGPHPAAFVRGFHHMSGPLVALVFGASLLLALAIGRPRYAYTWSGPGPFAWAYGIALVAIGVWTSGRRPAETSMPYTPHLTVVLFALAGYWGGLLAHPGGEIDGVASNAMVASVLLAIAYALARVAPLPRWGLGLVMAGVVLESAVTWALLANLVSGAPPFDSDINRRLKSDHQLVFLFDVVGGNWIPFGLAALGGQVGAVIALTRMREMTTTTATAIDRRD